MLGFSKKKKVSAPQKNKEAKKVEAPESMRESTKIEYQRMARGFYKRELGEGRKPSPAAIKRALLDCQSRYRANYWRKLRAAVAYDQEAKGFKDNASNIRKLENRTDLQKRLPKTPRKKFITEGEKKRVTRALKEKLIDGKPDNDLKAAVYLARVLGCRPSEMNKITVEGNTVTIGSAKYSKDRGMQSRTIEVSSDKLQSVKNSAKRLAGKDIKPIQKRFGRLMAKEFSDYKSKPTLYTFRHQKGSDLKASGLTREQRSYVMGHRGTKAIEAYGDRRTSGGGPDIKPSADADLSIIKENHHLMPFAHALPTMDIYDQMEVVSSERGVIHQTEMENSVVEAANSIAENTEKSPAHDNDNDIQLITEVLERDIENSLDL